MAPPPAVEAAEAPVTAGDRPLALLLDNAERGLDAMADRPAPRGVKAGLVISDVLAAVLLREDHLGEGAAGAGGTEEAAAAALLVAAAEEGGTPSDAARGETALRYRSRAVTMLPRDAPGISYYAIVPYLTLEELLPPRRQTKARDWPCTLEKKRSCAIFFSDARSVSTDSIDSLDSNVLKSRALSDFYPKT